MFIININQVMRALSVKYNCEHSRACTKAPRRGLTFSVYESSTVVSMIVSLCAHVAYPTNNWKAYAPLKPAINF